MRRTALLAMALIAIANAASAVTLVVQTDKLIYDIGDPIHVTITGIPGVGAKETAILGRLDYSAALTTTVTSSQTQHTRGNGTIFAITGILPRGDGFAFVFNQIIDGGGTGRTVDNIQIATATLIADASGIVEVFWNDDHQGLDFFGLTNANIGSPPNAITTFCIGSVPGCPVPEPTTGILLGLGLLALAARHNLVSPDRQKRQPTA